VYPIEPTKTYRRGLLFWRDANGTWRASNGEPGNQAIGMHLDRYEKQVQAYDAMEEKAINADDYLPVLEGIAPIVRSSRNLLDTLEQARQAQPNDRTLIDHRDKAYDISRQAELLYEDAKNSMDVAMVRRADEQAAAANKMMVSAHRLNILAAMFFPFATLNAIFGTTLTDGWAWSRSPIGFVIFLVVGILAGLVLLGYVSRPEKKR
jgi:F0F1-type ATP synthase assembly protein I